MPQAHDIALNELTEGGTSLGVVGTRVDAAHSLGDALASLLPLAEMPIDQAITDLVRVEGAVQLQLQADQLAAHLDRRRQELERREAQFHARQAAFEQELREARLWLIQRNDDLNEREARLGRSGVPEPEDGLPRPSPASHDGQGVSRWPSEVVWQERKQSLLRTSEELDRRRLDLEEFREGVSQMQEEALELRSAAEELQAELRGTLGTAAADSSLAAVRERMAQRYRNEVAYLTRRRNELECLKKDLAQEHAKLEQRFEELKNWVEQRKEVLQKEVLVRS